VEKSIVVSMPHSDLAPYAIESQSVIAATSVISRSSVGTSRPARVQRQDLILVNPGASFRRLALSPKNKSDQATDF